VIYQGEIFNLACLRFFFACLRIPNVLLTNFFVLLTNFGGLRVQSFSMATGFQLIVA